MNELMNEHINELVQMKQFKQYYEKLKEQMYTAQNI